MYELFLKEQYIQLRRWSYKTLFLASPRDCAFAEVKHLYGIGFSVIKGSDAIFPYP